MFGSANILTVILEVKNGDIYNPTTLQKLDQMTRWIVETQGRRAVPDLVDRAPEDEEHQHRAAARSRSARSSIRASRRRRTDADRVKFAVYATKGIRGLYVSEDDTAALVHAGFWEEDLDFDYL